jgi:hypothetical protein
MGEFITPLKRVTSTSDHPGASSLTSYKKGMAPMTFNQLLTCSEDPNEDREDRIPHFSAGKRSIITGLLS